MRVLKRPIGITAICVLVLLMSTGRDVRSASAGALPEPRSPGLLRVAGWEAPIRGAEVEDAPRGEQSNSGLVAQRTGLGEAARAQLTTGAQTLESRIQRRLRIIEYMPPYAYETGSLSGAVSTVWMDVTSGVLGTSELRQQYDQFYFAALEYRALAAKALLDARSLARSGRSSAAEGRIADADRLTRLFRLSGDGATQAYLGNSIAASQLAKGVYEGSKLAVEFGTSMILPKAVAPVGSAMVDALFLVTDFYVDSAEDGRTEATRRAQSKVLTLALMQVVPIEEYSRQTMSEAIRKSTTKGIGSSRLFGLLAQGLRNPVVRRDVLSFLGKSGAFAAEEVSERTIDSLILALTGGTASQAESSSQSKPAEGTTAQSSTSPEVSGAAGSTQGLAGAEVVIALGAITEQSRLYAITQMARQGAIRNPLAAEEVALIVKGTTGGNRAQAIAELAKLIKAKLTASEGATILGAQKDLDEQSRLYAIQALTRRDRLGDLASDAMLLLTGMTGGNRAQGIAEMAGFFKTGLSAQEVADTLGDPKQLNEQSRLYAIQVLARANKLAVWAADAAGPLTGTTHGNRAQAIAEMAKSLRTGLTAQEVAQLLGDPTELNEQNRLYAIQVLARTKKLAPWAADAARPLSGTTGRNRAQAIAEIAASLRAGLSGAEAAAILGSAEALNEQSRLYAVQALARARKLKHPLSGEELGLLLLGTSGGNRAQGLAELTGQR